MERQDISSGIPQPHAQQQHQQNHRQPQLRAQPLRAQLLRQQLQPGLPVPESGSGDKPRDQQLRQELAKILLSIAIGEIELLFQQFHRLVIAVNSGGRRME